MISYGMPTLIENKTLDDNIALCRKLGLSFIELNMNFPEYQIDKIENVEYMAAFRKFAELCEQWIGESDIKIAIENTNGFREYEKKAIEYMLERECFVLTWDIGHSKATNEEDVPFILCHKNKLKHFHIHDGKENPPKNHLALGDGEIDLNERLKLAEGCGARCVIETKTVSALEQSVEWIKFNS